MSTARYIASIAGFGLWMALQSQSLHAQFGPTRPTPADKDSQKAEKSLLPEAATKSAAAENKAFDSCQCVNDSESAAVERIERALRAPLHSSGLDFVEAPLKDVVDQTSSDYEIPIQLDKSALDEVGISEDEKVSVNIHNVSLRSALRLMLKNLQLTYLIRNEVLIITTPDAAQNNERACVYNVHELVGSGASDLHSIADMIQSCVSKDTWSDNGGTQAEIRPIKPDLLVISQTDAVHEEIRDLLSAIRKVHNQTGALPTSTIKSADAKHEEVVTRSYILQMNNLNEPGSQLSQIRELIVSAFPDETWVGRLTDGQSVLLQVFHDRIVVRQTPAVQEKVERILADSGIATLNSQGGVPGMSGGFGGGGMVPGGGFFGGGPEGGPGGAAGGAPTAFEGRAVSLPGMEQAVQPTPVPSSGQ